MSLERFVSGRLVVLRPDATVFQAARAMEENGIGAVLVGDSSGLVGIITDRDMATEVVARARNPHETRVEAVMTDVMCLPSDASIEEIAGAMESCGVRRIPLVDEDGRPVAIVTLDDLLAERMLPPAVTADILRTQLTRPARSKPAGLIGLRRPWRSDERRLARRAAHADATYVRFLRVVMDHTGVRRMATADRIARIGVALLCQRIRPDLARHFLSQLPLVLRESTASILDGPNRRITREEIERRLAHALDVPLERGAQLLSGLVQALEQALSPGQVETVRDQLPADLRSLFHPSSRVSPGQIVAIR